MKKILLVDDSTTVRNTLKATLCTEYNVVEALNGEDGLSKANGDNIDLFILDVNMPVMDGITMAGKLREVSKYTKTPIIMLTTESRAEKREQGKAAGATGWIVKPCDADKLLGVVSRLI
jgi:two-component system chemotaxis response regulator CheY